jgi:sugar phosphate isomerase/epimerase
MKILFSTGSLYYLPIEEVFALAGETGFDGCEIVVNQNFGNEKYLERVIGAARNLPVYSVHAPYVAMPAWGNTVQALQRTIEIAGMLRARMVNLHPPAWFSLELKFLRWFREVKDFQNLQPDCDVVIAVENMPRVGKKLMLAPYFLNDFEDLISFGVKKNLHFTLDITHLATHDRDVVTGFLRYMRTGRLRNVHFSDFGNDREHLFPGQGELPLVKLLNVMRRLGYDDMITLELAPNEWPKSEEWLVKLMRHCTKFLRLELGME